MSRTTTLPVLALIAATVWIAGCSSGEPTVKRAEAPPEPVAMVVVTDSAGQTSVFPSSPDTLVSGLSRDSLHAWVKRSVPAPESLRALVERSLPNIDSLNAHIRRGLRGMDSSWTFRFGPDAPMPPEIPLGERFPFNEFRFDEEVEIHIDSLRRELRTADSLRGHRDLERLHERQAERLQDQADRLEQQARRLENQTRRLQEQAERLERQAERLRDEAQRLGEQRHEDEDQRPAPDPSGP